MEFKFPDVGEGIAEGVLVRWLVKEGDTVKTDDVVCEVETDKSVAEIPSPCTGVVKKLFWKEGDTVPVGKVLMDIDDGAAPTTEEKKTEEKPAEVKEKAPEQKPEQKPEPKPEAKPEAKAEPKVETQPEQKQATEQAPQGKVLATPATRALAAKMNIDLSTVKGTGPDGRILKENLEGGKSSAATTEEQPTPAQSTETPTTKDATEDMDTTNKVVVAAPSTRRLARSLGIDIKRVKGTGAGGRISDEDVQKFKSGGAQAEPTPQKTKPSSSDDVQEPTTQAPQNDTNTNNLVPLTAIRKAIAKHLSTAVHTMAQATHMDSVDVTELVALREKEKPKAEKQGIKLSYLPFIIKATCIALKKYPQVNASLEENAMRLHDNINIGIAVDTKEGLLVPVIKDVQNKSILSVAKELVDLASAARDKKITAAQMQAGTFSITNIGSLGGEFFVPIVNYPQSAILGICKMKDAVVVKDGKIAIRKMMNIVVSYDHRILDGADIARFTNEIIAHLEDPDLLLLDS